VQGENAFLQIGSRISIHVLLALHGRDYDGMGRHQLLLVILGARLDTLGHEVVGDRSLDTRGVRFLGRYPPAQLVLRQRIVFACQFRDQLTSFLDGRLILEHLFKAMLVGVDSAGDLAMPESGNPAEISDASQEERKCIFHDFGSLYGED